MASAGKIQTNEHLTIHFYLILIWYVVIWHTPKIIICREQSFSNTLCPYISMEINIEMFMALSSINVWHDFNVNPLLSWKVMV